MALVFVCSVVWFLRAAPPKTLTITSGTPGSSFETNAIRYRQILARNGVTLKILSSRGSLENLDRLANSPVRVDVGFVQGGVTNGPNRRKLVSLGSVSYQPLMVFHRGATSLTLLSELAGKRLELLKEAFPHIARVGHLSDKNVSPGATHLKEVEAAARLVQLR
jgi:TRAP-type uncharacterized transport system substrate-binding protein